MFYFSTLFHIKIFSLKIAYGGKLGDFLSDQSTNAEESSCSRQATATEKFQEEAEQETDSAVEHGNAMKENTQEKEDETEATPEPPLYQRIFDEMNADSAEFFMTYTGY